MDITAITFADALTLTAAKFETEYAKITAHQITSLDMAQSFNWGVDLPMGGFGILAARHLNGHLLDARYFLDGNDSEAIQAAIDFAAATSEASGVVWLPRAASAYAIDSQITVPSGVTIMGDPHGTKLSLDIAAYAFKLNSSATDVVFRNLIVNGNNNTGGFCEVAGNVSRITFENIEIGVDGDEAATNMDGYLFDGSTNTIAESKILNCTIHGGTCLVSADGGTDVQIIGNRLVSSGQTTTTVLWIDLNGCDYLTIRDNYAWLHDSSNPLDRAMYLNNCDYAKIRGNEFWGARLSQVVLEDCLYAIIKHNEFISGATGGIAVDKAILLIKNDSHRCIVEHNTISCLDAISGTIPINAQYCVAFSDNVSWGSSYPVHCTLRHNLISTIDDASGNTGQWRCATTTCILKTANSVGGGNEVKTTGNQICEQMAISVSISGGSATEALTFPGLKTGVPLVEAITVTHQGANVQALRIHSTGTNTVTIGRGDVAGNSGNLASGLAYITVDA